MAWYNNDWGYRKKITLDNTNVDADLTNFPVLISVTDADLKTVAEGGHVGNAGATDIVFTNSADTKLDHEIQTYVAATGQLIAWVEVDVLDHDADTEIYMYYGNAGVVDQQNVAGTWGNGFVMVHHMEGAAYTDLDDATSNNNDVASVTGTPDYQSAGKIGYGVGFVQASNENLVVNDSGSLDIGTDKMTISAWVKITSAYTGIANKESAYRFYGGAAPGFFTLATANNGWYSKTVEGTTNLNDVLHLVAGIYDGSAIHIFCDTEIEATTTGVSGNVVANTSTLTIASLGAASYSQGIIDELRIANLARSEAWLKAEYYNQSDPATFCDFDIEETASTLYQATHTGAMTFAGTLNIKSKQILSGAITPTGVLNKTIKKIHSGSIIPTGGNKWSGLGMCMFTYAPYTNGDIDTLWANGFTQLRIDIPSWENDVEVAASKVTVLYAISKGFNVIWGVSSDPSEDTDYVITAENWVTGFRPAILAAAQWAQDNGVYEFQLGNEEEMHLWRHPVSITRTGNVATATFTEDHGFTIANPMDIWNTSPLDFTAWGVTITVTGAKTFTYPSIGDDGSVSNPGSVYIGNMSESTLESNLKSVATDVQAIFTRGNISYTPGFDYMDEWNTLGRGDIDILALNVYQNNADWQTRITDVVSWFGADHTYITEFNLNYISLDTYSTDEAVQATAVASMIDYIKASGITRANYFCYRDTAQGAIKGNGTIRQLWYVLIGGASLTKKILKITAGAIIPSGALTKKVNQILTGAISFIGTLTRTSSLIYYAIHEGTMTFVGTLNKKVSQLHTGVFIATGELKKTVRHILTGAVTFIGILANVPIIQLTVRHLKRLIVIVRTKT